MGTLFGITVIILTTTILVNGVQFYNNPIPVPGSSNNAVDPASQFLVSDENDGSYHFGYDTGKGKIQYLRYFIILQKVC